MRLPIIPDSAASGGYECLSLTRIQAWHKLTPISSKALDKECQVCCKDKYTLIHAGDGASDDDSI